MPFINGIAMRARREHLGLTREQLAASVGRSYSVITRLENDAATPSIATLSRIAETLDMPVADLLLDPAVSAGER